MIANKVIANKSDSKQKEAKPWDDKQMIKMPAATMIKMPAATMIKMP